MTEDRFNEIDCPDPDKILQEISNKMGISKEEILTKIYGTVYDNFEYIEVAGFKIKSEIKDGKRILHLNDHDMVVMKHKDGRFIHLHEGNEFWIALTEEIFSIKRIFKNETGLSEKEWSENYPQTTQYIKWLENIESKKD